MQRVFHAGFLFLHFEFGRRADVDDGHATGEFRQTFLQLLTIVSARGLGDLAADLVHAALDLRELAVAFNDGGVLFVHNHALGASRSSRPN